ENRRLRPGRAIRRNPGRDPRPLESEGEDRPTVARRRRPDRDARAGPDEPREVPRQGREHGHHGDDRHRACGESDDDPVQEDRQSIPDARTPHTRIPLHKETLTAREIATRYRVPIAACYRRIRRLVSLALISEAGFVTEGRRRPARLYKSEVDRFQIMYGNGKMHLQLLLRNGTEAKTVVGVPPDVGVS